MLLNILRYTRHILMAFSILALSFNVLLEVIPVFTNGSNEVTNAIRITNQQYALDERITKDVLALTQSGDHSQAILELQVSLPVFEKNQNGLVKNNDLSLELPNHIPGDIQLLIIQSQSDYAALDSAARSILKNADTSIDPNQLVIVQRHERPYFLQMNTIAKIWQQRIVDNAVMFFRVELGLGIASLSLLTIYCVLGLIMHKIQKSNDDKIIIETQEISPQDQEYQ